MDKCLLLLQKSMADLNKLIKVNKGDSNLNLRNAWDLSKKELVEWLLEEKLECPYPDHKGYSKVRSILSSNQQQKMITEDIPYQ